MTKEHKRVETGSLQFGDDWPGVFIRGDNAAYYGMILRQYLEKPENFKDTITEGIISQLSELLSGCLVTSNGNPKECQYVKDFNEVVLDKPSPFKFEIGSTVLFEDGKDWVVGTVIKSWIAHSSSVRYEVKREDETTKVVGDWQIKYSV